MNTRSPHFVRLAFFSSAVTLAARRQRQFFNGLLTQDSGVTILRDQANDSLRIAHHFFAAVNRLPTSVQLITFQKAAM